MSCCSEFISIPMLSDEWASTLTPPKLQVAVNEVASSITVDGEIMFSDGMLEFILLGDRLALERSLPNVQEHLFNLFSSPPPSFAIPSPPDDSLPSQARFSDIRLVAASMGVSLSDTELARLVEQSSTSQEAMEIYFTQQLSSEVPNQGSLGQSSQTSQHESCFEQFIDRLDKLCCIFHADGDCLPSYSVKRDDFPHVERSQNMRHTTRRGRESAVWKAGTGFGGHDFGPESSAQVHAAKDRECQSDLLVTTTLIDLTASIASISSALNEFELIRVADALQQSKAVRATLLKYLRNDSLMDIGARQQCYVSILDFLAQLARDVVTSTFLTLPLDTETDQDDYDGSKAKGLGFTQPAANSCVTLVQNLQAQARLFIKLQQGSHEEANDEIMEALAISLHISQTADDIASGVEFASCCGLLSASAQDTTGVSETTPIHPSEAVKHKSSMSSTLNGSAASVKECGTGSSASADAGAGASQAAYLEALRPQRSEQVALIEAIEQGTIGHSLFGKSAKPHHGHPDPMSLSRRGRAGTGPAAPVDSRSRMARIAKEVSSLISNLPVEYGSSIFVRGDEDRPDVMKALIIGPEGTPYENGCFEFDVLLPMDYPNMPPQVRIATTGGGTVRFNPNLYADGKVCLSLLGTSSGPGWDPATSSLLQALVSIQSLVLVPDPYYNEPGFERSAAAMISAVAATSGPASTTTTASASASRDPSKLYNNSLRFQTIRLAMLEQLRRPSPLFAQVIRDHFRLKTHAIRKQLHAWMEMESWHAADPYCGGRSCQGSSKAQWTELLTQVEAALGGHHLGDDLGCVPAATTKADKNAQYKMASASPSAVAPSPAATGFDHQDFDAQVLDNQEFLDGIQGGGWDY